MKSINIYVIRWRINEMKFLIRNREYFKLQDDLHEWILHNLAYVEREVENISRIKLETTHANFYTVKNEISLIKAIISQYENGKEIIDNEVLTCIIFNSINSIEAEIKKNWTRKDSEKDFEKGENQSWYKNKFLKLRLIMK